MVFFQADTKYLMKDQGKKMSIINSGKSILMWIAHYPLKTFKGKIYCNLLHSNSVKQYHDKELKARMDLFWLHIKKPKYTAGQI